MQLSVVIPTHRRAKLLERALDHLQVQTVRDALEVIVVSDGHDDETTALFSRRQWEFRPRFLEIPKSHQGVARNRGVELARGKCVLFSQDDVFLDPDACEWHLKCCEKTAILGFTTWDPELIVTPVMRWLEDSGWQFGYGKIVAYAGKELPPEIQHRFTYTSHISLPTAIAKAVPFREDVSLYGWEDIEWGLRLADKGVALVYEPRAKAVHHHPMTPQQSLKRMETLGRSAVAIEAIEPRLNVVPKGWKQFVYRTMSLLPTMSGRHRAAFLRGIEQARSSQP